MNGTLRIAALSLACALSLSAHAEGPAGPFNLPAGDLAPQLDQLARQSGTQLVYRTDHLEGLRTPGVRGAPSLDAALAQLLAGSGLATERDTASGAVVIVRRERMQPMRVAYAQDSGDAPRPADASLAEDAQEETVLIVGSRIPRAKAEGPAPITVITAQDIEAGGFATVPEVLQSITQNSGETQSQQSASGADFSPGAQQVDLRSLGPNHTLVLVNGRRIADFPMPFKGRSNFTDISNIPLGMVDRVEVLTGSASAVYGSDAISGVINFILKKKIDGTTAEFRLGNTTDGGGESYNLSAASGLERGNFTAVFGAEAQLQRPLWAYERDLQDSTLDAPTARSRVARRVFLRTNWFDEYLDPGQATCNSLSSLNEGSTRYSVRPRFGIDGDDGFYCGSTESIGYGTIITERKGINAYGSFNLDMANGMRWFADVQAGYHKLALFRDVTQWSLQTADGDEAGYFFNQATDQLEYWQRQFTPEEMGGLNNGMIRNTQKTFSVTTGFAGSFSEQWQWEAALSHSQYDATISWPQIVASLANTEMLGPQLGVDDDGYPIFNADPARLYQALTRAEYDAIAARTVYHPTSRTETLSFTVTNPALFQLPAGAAGFAGIVEAGSQGYDLDPDPLATQFYYYSWKDSDGKGSRNRAAVAAELRAPLLETVQASVAGRYDRYRYAGTNVSKATYSAGLEWRPLRSLLVRGSYGTAFRAADLHYIFAGPGNDETSGIDYFTCLSDDPAATDCSDYEEGLIRSREGSRDLKAETSTSWTAGFVWSPTNEFDVSVDYFDIRMRDQVQDMSVAAILRDEASCRLGDLNPASPTCVDALGRVTRVDDTLTGIFVNPINVARENTSGVDVSAHFKFTTRVGEFRLTASHTWVREHDFQQYVGDPVEDQFGVNSGFDIPRTKTSATIAWSFDDWSASLYAARLGKLPTSDSFDQVFDPEDGVSPWIGATYRFNLTGGYRFSDALQMSVAVNNLTDEMPPEDDTYTAYPYYDVSWFDTVGRSVFVNLNYKFGEGN